LNLTVTVKETISLKALQNSPGPREYRYHPGHRFNPYRHIEVLLYRTRQHALAWETGFSSGALRLQARVRLDLDEDPLLSFSRLEPSER
jgi:hypothetical protein